MSEKIVFLDRDGVINQDPGERYYVHVPDDFELIPGSAHAIKNLNQNAFKVFVVSNQSGISKGIVTQSNLDQITDKLKSDLKAYGAHVDGVFCCPHQDSDRCGCRKPKKGLFEEATKGLEIDWPNLFSIGDTERDIAAAKSFGCQTILVFSGVSKEGAERIFKTKPDHVYQDLSQAVRWILKKSAS